MLFERIIEDGRLWAVRYDKDKENALQKVLSQWPDAEWLADFFTQNFDDLISYFRITNIEDAIFQTMEERDDLACIILDISPEANLDHFFRPLDNNQTREMLLGKEKGVVRIVRAGFACTPLNLMSAFISLQVVPSNSHIPCKSANIRCRNWKEWKKSGISCSTKAFLTKIVLMIIKGGGTMTQEEAIARLSLYESTSSSKWREEEEQLRQANAEGWLRYSRRIAIKIALAMKQQNLSRQDLAERLGCSTQYVSRFLKGEENLSLETICKLEDALNISILQYEFA